MNASEDTILSSICSTAAATAAAIKIRTKKRVRFNDEQTVHTIPQSEEQKDNYIQLFSPLTSRPSLRGKAPKSPGKALKHKVVVIEGDQDLAKIAKKMFIDDQENLCVKENENNSISFEEDVSADAQILL